MKAFDAKSPHRCEVCSSTFRRAEHLKRHLRSHSSERPYACATCGKAFARSDILHRHELNHSVSKDRPANRLTTGTFRACTACAAARQRCSGGSPCARCSKRNIDCIFPRGCEPLDGSDASSPSPSEPKLSDGQPHFVVAQSVVYPAVESNDPSRAQNTIANSLSHHHAQEDQYRDRLPSIVPLAEPAAPQGSAYALGNHQTTQMLPLSSAHSTLRGSQVHNVSWQPNSSFNSSTNQLPPFDNIYAQNIIPSPIDFDNDWFNQSLNWIPLSMYPSPSDLEAEFHYALPSDPGVYHSMDDGIDWQSSHNSDQQSQDRTMSIANVSEVEATPQTYEKAQGNNEQDCAPEIQHQGGTSNMADPGYKRRRLNGPPATLAKVSRIATLGFPNIPEFSIRKAESKTLSCFPNISLETYNLIATNFELTCLSGSHVFPPFHSSHFPSPQIFNICTRLYLEDFHPRLPIVHVPSISAANWTLWLAVSAIGATFLDIEHSLELAVALQEFLHRVISINLAQDSGNETLPQVVQGRVLNVIGLSQSRLEAHRALVPRFHAALARSLLEGGWLQNTGQDDPVPPTMATKNYSNLWQKWIDCESRRRVGYFIWMIDSAMAYISNSGPICSMDDARAPLPCSEALWGSNNAISWAELWPAQPDQPSLCSAMETMYLRKQIPVSLSETGHILLIHALYQKTWAVGKHLKQPLSDWMPSAKTRGFIATPSKDSFWLPSYPLYANWRNSACDCLDVLQWHVAGVVARASSVEHHLMLHLHLARVVLLTPFQEIDDLCSSLLQRYERTPAASFYVHDGSYQIHDPAKLPQIRKITWRWLREDQHKARLGALHAGLVFWHVRRYSSNTFFEPTAIYLASIVLWVYGSYRDSALSQVAVTAATSSHSRGNAVRNGAPTLQADDHLEKEPTADGLHITPATNQELSRDPSPGTDGSQIEYPKFIHLDRPCDDEMVRHFVRHGQSMACHMSPMGDICESPRKVLLEGAKLLKSKLWQWGVSEVYHQRLKALAALKKGR